MDLDVCGNDNKRFMAEASDVILCSVSLRGYIAHCMDGNIYVSVSAVDFLYLRLFEGKILTCHFGSASKCLNNRD